MTTGNSSEGSTEAFAELGKIVLGEQPLSEILDRVVHLAKRVLPVPTEASITLVAGDDPTTIAFTAEMALALDERQYEAERGPCLDASAAGQIIPIRDMSAETRWPRFSKAAVEAGVSSSLSVPLPIQRQVTGAINFYAKEQDAFTDEAVDLATAFADHAAVAVANAHLYETIAALAEQMKQAMTTRAVIEQAKGIIMRERSCNADEAFNLLVRRSQQSHLKLRDVAVQLVAQVSSSSDNSPS